MNVKLVSKTQGVGEFEGKSIEDIIVYCARVSSSREDKFDKPEGLLNYCIKNKHWSIFETGSITFEIETSKAIGIQLLRHRSFTFQEFSQRYSSIESFEKVELRKQADKNRQSSSEIFDPVLEDVQASQEIESVVKQSYDLYVDLLNSGVAKECARMVLPLCTTTKLYMTGSIRSWLGFLNVRLDQHSQSEIREISKNIGFIIEKECPTITRATNNFNNYKGLFM